MLNLIASVDCETALKRDAYSSLNRSTFAKLQTLFNKQSRSTLASEKTKELLGKHLKLLKRIEPFLLIGVLFVIPNATRWNAWFDSVNHVVKLLDANGNIEQQEKMSENLNLLCEHHGIGDLKSQEILFMQEYVSLMQPIAIALDVLQGETGNQVTAGHLIPAIVVIKRKIQELRNSKKLRVCEPLADALLKGIENRFNNYFFSDELRLASVIHPKFKFNWLSDGYSSEEEIDASKTGFIAELKRKIEIMIQADSKAISGATNNIIGLDVRLIDPKDFFAS